MKILLRERKFKDSHKNSFKSYTRIYKLQKSGKCTGQFGAILSRHVCIHNFVRLSHKSRTEVLLSHSRRLKSIRSLKSKFVLFNSYI